MRQKVQCVPGNYLLGILLVAALVLVAAPSYADPATARIFQQSATEAVVEIDLSAPAPANIIVQLQLGGGVRIVAASPEPAKVDARQGAVKWLLKDTRPGRYRLVVTTGSALNLDRAAAVIRYRQPVSGEMVEIRARR